MKSSDGMGLTAAVLGRILYKKALAAIACSSVAIT